MTIDELIHELEELKEDHGGDCEIRLMTQPSYPLQHKIAGVVHDVDIANYDAEVNGEDADGEEERENVAWILEGGHPDRPYGHRDAWDAV